MCIFGSSPSIPPQPSVPDTSGREAIEQGRLERRLRQRRAGAAANVLTGPTGIPAKAQLGAAG